MTIILLVADELHDSKKYMNIFFFFFFQVYLTLHVVKPVNFHGSQTMAAYVQTASSSLDSQPQSSLIDFLFG